MNDATPQHPGAETMAAFLEGRLQRDELASVAAHLRDCRDCRLVIGETARFEREEETRAPQRNAWWLAAAAAVLLLVAVPIALRIAESHRAPIARLVSLAPHDHRTVEPRLSGFPWARLALARGTQKADPADLKLAGAAGDVLEKTEGQRDAESRHAAGVANLLIGHRSDGIAALEESARSSRDARVWNDLAAARYAAAIDDDRPSQLHDALADVAQALAIDPKLLEARFNNALILERLGLADPARKAWQSYLELDPGSGWSVEAREHLRALQAPSGRFDPRLFDRAPAEELARDFPEETRRRSETMLLAAWADAELHHDPTRAASLLARARAIGDALARLHDEHLLDDAVATIEHSTGPSRAALAGAHRLYDSGRRAFAARKLDEAEKAFADAAAAFERTGSPMADVARYYAANVALNRQRSDAAESELLRLASSNPRHRALTAEIHWTLALNANRGGDWGDAIREADAAATGFRQIGERASAAFADGIAAYSLEMIGEPDLAARRRVRASATLCSGSAPERCNAFLADTALAFAAVQRTSAAAALIAIATESSTRDAAALAYDRAKQVRVLARAGDPAGARRALKSARDALAGVSDPSLRAQASATIDVEEAALRIAADPHGAVAALDRAASFFTQKHLDAALPYVLLQRARAHRAAGDAEASSRDYAAALQASTAQERSLADPAAFRDTVTEAIEESIALELSRNAPEAAFAIADRRHQLTDNATPTPLARNVALIEYAVLPDSIAIFCRANGHLIEQSVAIDRRELATRIESFTQRIVRRDDVTHDAAALYRLLIEPLRPNFGAVDELVIVPDRQLYALPFAALYDDRSARFLVEEFVIRIAPAAAGVRPAHDTGGPALVIADPRRAGESPLRGSREEASRIAALDGATLLEGEEATAQRFLDLAPRSALVHYAGHANSDATTSYAALLLADRLVGAKEIAALQLARRPLVVLAACGTFRGDPSHVAGMSSLARAFLLAGARGVVATLWEIDDDVSPPLFFRFHESLRAGASPARALRDAQLTMLRSPNARLRDPATWSPVVDVENN